MSRAKLVDFYIEKSSEKEFEIDQIRKELEARDIPNEDIKAIDDAWGLSYGLPASV